MSIRPESRADTTMQMLRHLTAPLGAGAVRTTLDIDAAGKIHVPKSRRPLLLISLLKGLKTDSLEIILDLNGLPSIDPVFFAPFSPEGALLPIWCGDEGANATEGILRAKLGMAAIPAADLASLFRLDLVEGNLGRLLSVLGDEKVRLRREMARLAAMRSRDFAAEDALDRIGIDLGVPRLETAPRWDPGHDEIISEAAPESDIGYRKRLHAWRPFLAPTPAAVRKLLQQVDPRIIVQESETAMAVSVRFIGSSADASDPARAYLIGRLRADRLVFLNDRGKGAALHTVRPATTEGRAQEAAIRSRLATAFAAEAEAAVAPRLARALDRAARILIALGAEQQIVIARAQDAEGGSRFEAGMGVLIRLPSVAEADALRTAMLKAAVAPSGNDPIAHQLIQEAAATNPSPGDRTLAWLWSAAGFATIHQVDQDSLYLSHLTSGGLAIETQRAGNIVTLRAVFHAPGDTGHSAALQRAIRQLDSLDVETIRLMTAGMTRIRLASVIDLAATDPANNILAAAGLPAGTKGKAAVTALNQIPPDLWVAFDVETSLAADVRTGNPAATVGLAKLVAALRQAGFVSALPLPNSTNGLCILASVVSLPTAGVNLGERIATGVRWLMVPLAGQPTLRNASGFTTELSVPAGSLAAVVALAYVRDGTPDPYEVEIDLPDGELLDLAGYEQLMNALERSHPIGVQINTWRLRQQHVDLDGDGHADPLPPRLARHYRQFHMPRMRGLDEPDAQGSQVSPLTNG